MLTIPTSAHLGKGIGKVCEFAIPQGSFCYHSDSVPFIWTPGQRKEGGGWGGGVGWG